MARYLARLYGFNGANDKEAILIDMVYEGSQDFLTNLVKVFVAPDETAKAAETEKLVKEVEPKWFGYFEKLLAKNNGGSGFFVGDKVRASLSSCMEMTVADHLSDILCRCSDILCVAGQSEVPRFCRGVGEAQFACGVLRSHQEHPSDQEVLRFGPL